MPLCAIEPRARISCKGRGRKSTCLSETVEEDADAEGDHGEHVEQRGNADQQRGEPKPLLAWGERDGAGAHQRKCDDLDRGLEGGEAAEIEAMPHHRGYVVQPVHQHQRAKRHDRVTQTANGGKRQRRECKQGWLAMYALMSAPPRPGPGISDMSPNRAGT